VPFSHPPGQWATHLLPEGLLGSEVYPFLHVQVLGAVQSAFKQGSRQWGSQIVPVLSRVQPGSQPQTFGPIHLPFLHPLGHSATQVSWISLKPGLQEHLLGPMQTPAPQPPSQKNSHLLVFLLRVNLQQVLQFLCVVSVGNQQYNTHTYRLFGETYPGLQRHASAPTHSPPCPQPPVQTGVQNFPSGLSWKPALHEQIPLVVQTPFRHPIGHVGMQFWKLSLM
jgi:hypothetical protein